MKMTENCKIFIMKLKQKDNITQILITLTGFFYWYFNRSDLGLGQSDNINQMIRLTEW
jgi:hypothetical protein